MRGRGACVAGSCMAGGRAWQGACVAGVCVWQGGMHGGGHLWQGGMHAWQGGVHGGGGVCMPPMPPPSTLRDTVGQCAGGTHPTAMHSCLIKIL